LAGRHVSKRSSHDGRSYAIAAAAAVVLLVLARLLMAVTG
jgi:hypothetical protein